MFKQTRSALAILLAAILILGVIAPGAFAESPPAAYITAVSGDVTVKKAGGSKTIPAFVNMPLGQGDYLATGQDGSLTIRIAKPESNRTLGPGSEATIKKLANGSSGNKFGIKLWEGSMWSSVSSLKNNDEDIVETPASKLEVKGTNFLVTVKADGTLSVAVASGLVTASVTGVPSGTSNSSSEEFLLAPTQQFMLDPNHPPKNLQNSVNIIDISQTIGQADAGILKAFLLSAPAIVGENEAFVQGLASSLEQGKQPAIQREGVASDLTIGSQDELQKYQANLRALIANVASTAISLDSKDSAGFLKLIEDVNKQIPGSDSDIDARDADRFDPAVGIDPAAAEAKEAEQARILALRQQQERVRAELEQQLLQKLQSSMEQILRKKDQLIAENKDVLSVLQQQAEQSYMSLLTPEELAKYKEDRNSLASKPATSPQLSTQAPSGPSGPSQPVPSVELIKQDTAGGLALKIQLKQFTGTKALYAAEFHFAVEGAVQADTTKGRLLNNQYFAASNSIDSLNNVASRSDLTATTETIYAATNFGDASAVSITDGTLATIPFTVSGSGTVRLIYVKIVDKTGADILELNSGSTGLPAAISVTR
ncbi:MAG: FecR domain-containing protein [Cohnella sp.]|nr:FecR domain-containing protein [Cohnella sp.]